MEKLLIVEDRFSFNDSTNVIADSRIPTNLLIFGGDEIQSLSISKRAEISNNRVLNISPKEYRLSTQIIGEEELEYAMLHNFLCKIILDKQKLETDYLKILSISNKKEKLSSKFDIELSEI